MEQKLDAVMDEMMQVSDVRGVLMTDRTGMCLGSRGEGEKLNAGGIDRMAKIAATLDSEGQLPRIMVVEGESSLIMIQQKENFVLTLVKEVITAVPTS